jgi:uncharacterized caspase-like protein
LKGAVHDATLAKDFIRKIKSNREALVAYLLDSEATMNNMIMAIRDFARSDNQAVQKDDPILFFFAGHGATLRSPEGWLTGFSDEKIECLIPFDVTTDDKYMDNVIPDRQFSALIKELADSKGNNIVGYSFSPQKSS